MFGIGWTEMVILGILALLVLGPEKLPAAAQQMGKWMRELRAASANLREEFQSEFHRDEWAALLDDNDDRPGAVDEADGVDELEARASLERPADEFGRPIKRPRQD